jgi:hypothetical protein
VLLDVLRKKCEFKGIAIPKAADLDPFKDEIEAGWEHMLGHQLPALAPVAPFWDALPEFFAWLESSFVPTIPPPYTRASGETILRDRTLRLPVAPAVQSHVEVIRFAAANRLCVDLGYGGSTRRIEPYSLRRTRDGNIVLHAWNIDSDAHRSYRVDRILGARTTIQVFTPRYAVELTPSGPVSIPPTQRSASDAIGASFGGSLKPRAPKSSSRSRVSRTSGPTYIHQCGTCGKKFRRKTRSTRMNKHKSPGGWPCPGRVGYYVDTKR